MSDTTAHFSSGWPDLRGVSFKQHYIDATGIRIRCFESGDPSKPVIRAMPGGGRRGAGKSNAGPSSARRSAA